MNTYGIIALASSAALLMTVGGLPLGATQPSTSTNHALLIGVWSNHKSKPAPRDVKPRIEFQENGKYRSRNQVGEESWGRWRWISTDSIQLQRDRKAPVRWRVQALSKTHLRIAAPTPIEFMRLDSWKSEDPLPAAQ